MVQADIERAADVRFDIDCDVLVVGAGACGLTAALAVADAGREAVLLERDASPTGSTSLSSGMVPAAGTAAQQRLGIVDSHSLFAADIQAKAKGAAPQALVETLASQSGSTIDWLTNEHDIPFSVVEGFLYPGHSVSRMHATPARTGADLQQRLLARVQATGGELVTNATVATLLMDEHRVSGVRVRRPDGNTETVGCRQLILACNGYGGNARLVEELIPEMADGEYFGHPGNQGDAVYWGRALQASMGSLGAYQGHGSVASPHQVLITWALMMEGGIQVNADGERFSNEHDGYSEQSVRVLAQPGRIAWNIFDAELHELGMEFEDYRNAVSQGALVSAMSVSELANQLGLPESTLAASVATTATQIVCPFGRDFSRTRPLAAPFHAIRVTGALFHTQGGLDVNAQARVLRQNGQPFPNLFAGGGAARGVSGNHVWGYLSGNGLLSAITLGRLAGRNAAA
ncbi:MAG: FAD-dependent oxidoreductase [Pseudomonadota bacterium]